MSDLSEELRRRAEALRQADVVPEAAKTDGTILQEIPNGPGHALRVVWRQPPGASPLVSIRVWRETGHGLMVPVRDVGIEIPYFRLPKVAEGIAHALELARLNVIEFRRSRPLNGKGR